MLKPAWYLWERGLPAMASDRQKRFCAEPFLVRFLSELPHYWPTSGLAQGLALSMLIHN